MITLSLGHYTRTRYQTYNIDTYDSAQPNWTLEEIDAAFQMDGNDAQQPYNVWLDKVTSTAGYCMATAKVLHSTIWLTAVGIGVARGRVSGWEGARWFRQKRSSTSKSAACRVGRFRGLASATIALASGVLGIGLDSSLVATDCCKCARSYPHSTLVPHQSVLVTGQPTNVQTVACR